MSRIPTAVLEAEEKADAAIEADASTFNASSLGAPSESEGITIHEDAPFQPNAGSRQPEQGQSARTDETQQTNQGGEQAGQKIELTQEELAQRVAAGKREVQGLYESRLRNMTQVTDENKNLRKRVDELERELASKTANERPDVQKLREEYPEFATYDDDELITITSAMKRTVERQLSKVLPNATKNIREEIDAGNKAAAMQSFVATMENKYPGLGELDRTNDAAWLAFLDTAIPGTGGRIKYGNPAQDAMNSMDVKALSEIVEEFSKQSGFTFGSRGVDPRVASQVRARQSNAGNAHQPQPKPYFTKTQVDRFYKDLNSGAIKRSLAPDAIEALRQDIESAEDEGRIIPG
jgi:hypothetical protein